MFDQDLESSLRRQTHLKVSTLETLMLLQINLVLEQTKFASWLSINLLWCCEHRRRHSLHRSLLVSAQLYFNSASVTKLSRLSLGALHKPKAIRQPATVARKTPTVMARQVKQEERGRLGRKEWKWRVYPPGKYTRPAELQFIEHLFQYSTENELIVLLFKGTASVCSCTAFSN